MGSFSGSKGARGRDPFKTAEPFLELIERNFGKLLGEIGVQRQNPFLAGITGSVLSGQERSRDDIEAFRGEIKEFRENLRRNATNSALSSTDAATLAAIESSRRAGGLRSDAPSIAARNASNAAIQQNTALLQSQNQAEIAGFQAEAAALNAGLTAESQFSDLLSRGSLAQAGLFENRELQRAAARENFVNILGSIATSGISGTGGSPLTRSRGHNTAIVGGNKGGGSSSE